MIENNFWELLELWYNNKYLPRGTKVLLLILVGRGWRERVGLSVVRFYCDSDYVTIQTNTQ